MYQYVYSAGFHDAVGPSQLLNFPSNMHASLQSTHCLHTYLTLATASTSLIKTLLWLLACACQTHSFVSRLRPQHALLFPCFHNTGAFSPPNMQELAAQRRSWRHSSPSWVLRCAP